MNGKRLAFLVWAGSAAPIMASSIVWFKMHPLLGVSHGLGWRALWSPASIATRLLR